MLDTLASHIFKQYIGLYALLIILFCIDLYGANNWEAAVCDMVVDSVVSVFGPAATYQRSKGEGKTDEERVCYFYTCVINYSLLITADFHCLSVF